MIEEKQDRIVLCGANSYEQKYYFNEQFSNLPENIRQELQIMCVLYTEDVGGILTLEFEEDGTLEFKVTAEESDYLFDEIGRWKREIFWKPWRCITGFFIWEKRLMRKRNREA